MTESKRAFTDVSIELSVIVRKRVKAISLYSANTCLLLNPSTALSAKREDQTSAFSSHVETALAPQLDDETNRCSGLLGCRK